MCLDTLYRFIFNSDYPTDKVVWLNEGSVKLNGSGNATVKLDITATTGFIHRVGATIPDDATGDDQQRS